MKFTKRNISSIDVAKMRDIASLMQPTIILDGRGGQTITYTETDVFTFFIRFNSDVTETWKIKYAGDEYTIHGVENVDAVSRFTQIVAYTKQ
jgi:hypothetical protein